MSSQNSKYNIMDNQEDITNYNLMKVIGLSALIIILIFSLLTQKGDTSVLGIPSDVINKTDSTTIQ